MTSWLPTSRRRWLLLAGDMASVATANLMAALLRFDFDWSSVIARRHRNLELLAFDLVATPLAFIVSGLYQGYLRYLGLSDLMRLARAVVLRTVLLVSLFYGLGILGLSRAVLIMSTLLVLVLAGALRLAPRFQIEYFSARRRRAAPRTLILGAGDTGEALLREWRKRTDATFNPVGFLDDSPDKRGVKIHGISVLGDLASLAGLVEATGAQEVVIAIPSLSPVAVRRVFEICRTAGVHLRTVPSRGELTRGLAQVDQLRPVDLEDLLSREVVRLDLTRLHQGLRGKRVLVTGAAGSIGRELARQVAAYEPAHLLLVDRSENSLFYLEQELRPRIAGDRADFVLADIADRPRMERLFRTHQPSIVLHAAAFKHVPLMEAHPVEAVRNNVLATRALAELAAASGVERFIYISTDKAVRPTSVMGATKSLGERLLKSMSGGATRFMAVRFGNVLGSDGSVVPTFRRQISAGGPVTVTHPEATRYFMTIQEAVQLVLTAGVTGEGGETFLLQMGEPVRILDLARNLIELSGLRPDIDLPIAFTGLRPGEKLHEELSSAAEEALPTSNEKILALSGVRPLDDAGLRALARLQAAAVEGSREQVLALLRQLVPDYLPTGAGAAGPGDAALVVDIATRKRAEPAG